MIKKKVCLVGAEAVGKTSLVRRFVDGLFSDRYLTTVAVKVTRKLVRFADSEVLLVVWDLAGDDELQPLRTEYLTGAAGYIVVADGTRFWTFTKALELQRRVERDLGPVPFVLAVNKADLGPSWFDLDRSLLDAGHQDWVVVRTSALAGSGVEEAFRLLGERLVADRAPALYEGARTE